eukprot:scaffold694_cov338-Pavlova_lutheri.AAC.16
MSDRLNRRIGCSRLGSVTRLSPCFLSMSVGSIPPCPGFPTHSHPRAPSYMKGGRNCQGMKRSRDGWSAGSSMVEYPPSKRTTRVRFPASA